MSPGQTPLGIVVGVDGSPPSTAAVEWAARDAEMRNVPLRLVHVAPPVPTFTEPWPIAPLPADYSRAQEEQAQRVIEEAHKIAAEATSPRREPRISSEVFSAPIVPTLIDLSEQADMVVVGCRGLSAVNRALLGSVSADLVRHARCPVAVIHDEDGLVKRPSQAPVMVGVDGSPTSELATELAFDAASRRGVGLVALHAWSDMGPLDFGRFGRAPIEWANLQVREEEVLAERLSGWRERYPDVVVHKVVVSD